MSTASSRLLIVLAIFATLAGCAADRPRSEPATGTLRTALPPAELPTYGIGDTYTFDKPEETWRVVAISKDLVSWESADGGRQATMFDPLLPPVSWQRPDGRQGDRKILEWSGSLFPLKAGNKLTFKTALAVAGTAGHARFIWNCYTGHPRQVTVPAGDFAAFPVFCRRNDGWKVHSYYAPALHRPIAITTRQDKAPPVSRQLIAFKLGSGPRVAATKRESLPGGWSAAAVTRLDKEASTSPRIAPGALATADPPLSFAGPVTGRSLDSSRSKVPKQPGKADKSRIAERDPARKTRQTASKSEFGVHIGSFHSEERAELGWTLFGSRYGTALKDAPHLVVSVDLGESKGKMYRVLAGPFETAAEGTALCNRVKAQGGYCRVLAIPKG
jgi:cell division septation protein DedD